VALLVTVDTEEDQWGPKPEPPSTENILLLPRLHRIFADLDLRPTYFTTYRVASDPDAAAVLRDLASDDRTEIGAHLHPWNTPPVREAPLPRNSMLSNLPAALQQEKLETLTRSLVTAFGRQPVSFRAGRLGLGTATARALRSAGYTCECSVAPFTDLGYMDDGPDFSGAPLAPYWLDGSPDVSTPGKADGLLEIPLSVGYTRSPLRAWHAVESRLAHVTIRGRHLTGVLSRAGIVEKVSLEPEQESAAAMEALALQLVRAGVPHLQLLLHSTSLLPGHTPFTRNRRQVLAMLRAIADFVQSLRDQVSVRPACVHEFGTRYKAGLGSREPTHA
jgi:hypothetical protein